MGSAPSPDEYNKCFKDFTGGAESRLPPPHCFILKNNSNMSKVIEDMFDDHTLYSINSDINDIDDDDNVGDSVSGESDLSSETGDDEDNITSVRQQES